MKSILIGLLFMTSTVLSQSYIPDSTYCLPIDKARRVIADAARLRQAEKLLNTSEERVALLESEKIASYKSFIKLLNIEQQKYTTQKENTGHMERLAMSYKSERDYYIKRERKQRRKKNILSYSLLVLLTMFIVK